MSPPANTLCERFIQNAWKKDLCSNCFKSKEEHANLAPVVKPVKVPSPSTEPPKGIIKSGTKKQKKNKVSFPKELSQVIGFGGEWNDSDSSDAEPEINNKLSTTATTAAAASAPITIKTTTTAVASSTEEPQTPDEVDQDLLKITKSNTDFNMNNGNLLGDPEVNIKRSFAALKLGAPLKDGEGKKQTLKITVTPFNASGKVNEIKQLFGTTKTETSNKSNGNVIIKMVKKVDENNEKNVKEKCKEADSPEIVSISEKSLLEEISETLEKNKNNKDSSNLLQMKATETTVETKQTEISAVRLEIKNPLNKVLPDSKRPIARHNPITKDQVKPRINVFPKNNDTDSNSSDLENSASDYYDVVDSTNSYENVPDGFEVSKAVVDNGVTEAEKTSASNQNDQKSYASNRTSFFSSQFISDMFLSNKPVSEHLKKRSEIYNLSDGSYITGKITSDGLIVTKSNSEDALDSTGSSFDSSSDEEMSSMNRSESDSGIVANEYQNVDQENRIREFSGYDTTSTTVSMMSMSQGNCSSDYEDVQVQNENGKDEVFSIEKSRELAGEPDGSSDPDGSGEAPALPSSPPPSVEPRTSFLHNIQKHLIVEKPIVPTKPTVNIIKAFAKKPQNLAQQQVILQLQSVIKPSTETVIATEKPILAKQDSCELNKTPRKGRAPNPPPSPSPSPTEDNPKEVTKDLASTEDKLSADIEGAKEISSSTTMQTTKIESTIRNDDTATKVMDQKANVSSNGNKQVNVDDQAATIYMRNPSAGVKSNSPVVREKDKRERATINPKFRSLNTINSSHNNNHSNDKMRSSTPEPAPRKSLSLSTDNLQIDDKKPKKTKFSIKKFLRMGSHKHLDSNYSKKEGIYNEFQSIEEGAVPQAKPRLVIIHPIDINTSGVEVVKDAKSGNPDVGRDELKSIPHVTGKPPAPPVRTGVDGHRLHDLNKPARPPPPKSAELRRKQQIEINLANVVETAKPVNRTDNVYANLGEVRSAIAPRKPERTASMREREAQLELARRRPIRKHEYPDTASDISSSSTFKEAGSGGSISRSVSDASEKSMDIPKLSTYLHKTDDPSSHNINSSSSNNNEINATINIASPAAFDNKTKVKEVTENEHNSEINSIEQKMTQGNNSKQSSAMVTTVTSSPSSPSASSSSSSSSAAAAAAAAAAAHNNTNNKLSSKVEMFERTILDNQQSASVKMPEYSKVTKQTILHDGIKNSVQKMTHTIDSYLKDKLSSSVSEVNIPEIQSMYNGGGSVRNFNLKSSAILPNSPNIHRDGSEIELRANFEPPLKQTERLSLPDNGSIYAGSIANGYRRNDYEAPPQVTKFNSHSFANIPRAISMSYCGSEMGESEIYSPYSFYGSEAGNDVALGDPQDGWGISSNAKNRQMKTTNRLRMRKGRSVVHKNLEDNYGAVIVANHEALAQVLDQLQQSPTVPTALRPLANSMNLRFDDFAIMEGGRAVVIGRRAFHAAIFANQTPVTLALTADCNQMSGVCGELNQLSGAASGALNPITEFCDLVPSNYLPLMPSVQVRMVQSSISVFPRMYVDTLMSLGAILKSKTQQKSPLKSINTFGGSIPNLSVAKDAQQNVLRNCSVQNLTVLNEDFPDDDHMGTIGTLPPNPVGFPTFDEILCREVGFVMLQLVNGLKSLQAKGIEEMPLSLSNVILCKEVENKEAQARLCVLQCLNHDMFRGDEEESMSTLCQCAHVALTTMLPATKLTTILSEILLQERSESLSKVKSLLEFALWGPSDVTLSGSGKERELALQRWLDLERATVLHGLVRTRVELTVYDECHLMFLVRSNAKIMCEASTILHNFINNTEK